MQYERSRVPVFVGGAILLSAVISVVLAILLLTGIIEAPKSWGPKPWGARNRARLLVSASEPDPASKCAYIPAGAFRVFAGETVSWFFQTEDMPIVVVGGRSFCSLRLTSDGLAVCAALVSVRRELEARLLNNQLVRNPNRHFSMEFPDQHTLAVFEGDNPVLIVRYINPHAAVITGRFRPPSRDGIVIGGDKIWIGDQPQPADCRAGEPAVQEK